MKKEENLKVPRAVAYGLKPEQIENLRVMSIATTGGIDTQYMLREKKRMIKCEENREARVKRLASMTITERMTCLSRAMNKAIADGYTPRMMIPLQPLWWRSHEEE